jgi:hypothetical protein
LIKARTWTKRLYEEEETANAEQVCREALRFDTKTKLCVGGRMTVQRDGRQSFYEGVLPPKK